MEELGIASLDDVRGLTIRRIEERKKEGKVAVTERIVPKVDHPRSQVVAPPPVGVQLGYLVARQDSRRHGLVLVRHRFSLRNYQRPA
jgi:hypothetical protein